jgi:hypothetical protein
MKDVTGARFRVAFAAGLLGFVLSFAGLHQRGFGASDFSWPLRAAERVAHGENPYTDPRNMSGPYPFHAPFYYPIHAAIVAIPFSAFEPYTAGALFFGVSSALLAFGLWKKPNERFRFLLFFSASFWWASRVAQWSPLLMASVYLPALLPVMLAKPNLGSLAFFASGPTLKRVVGLLAPLVVSLILFPFWPQGWLNSLAYNTSHYSPIRVLPLGPVLLLAVLRWREQGARILLLAAFVPQLLFFYDQLFLWLIPRSWRSGLFMLTAGWLGEIGRFTLTDGGVASAQTWVTAATFIPALLIVLRPHELALTLHKRWTERFGQRIGSLEGSASTF